MVMDNNFISLEDPVTIDYFYPPKGSEIIFQPEDNTFHDLENNKEILEEYISYHYKILQLGDRIGFKHNEVEYNLEITHLEPCDVVLCHETEMILDYRDSIINECKDRQIEKQLIKEKEEQERVIKENNSFLTQLYKERQSRQK